MFSFSLESIYITMNSIRPPQHPRQEEAGEVQGEVGPQLRKFLKNLGCQKCTYSHYPGACPPPGQLWPRVPLTRPLCTHPQAHPSYSFVSCQAPQVCTGKATLVENSSCFFLCSPNDIDRVRMLIRDLTIKALIPWVEKQLKHLHEVVTNRKSRCD